MSAGHLRIPCFDIPKLLQKLTENSWEVGWDVMGTAQFSPKSALSALGLHCLKNTIKYKTNISDKK